MILNREAVIPKQQQTLLEILLIRLTKRILVYFSFHLCKAFDTLHHQLLLEVLMNLDVKDTPLKWNSEH